MKDTDKRPIGKRDRRGIIRTLTALLSLLALILFGCTDSVTDTASSTQPLTSGTEVVENVPPDYYISFVNEDEVYRCDGNPSVSLSSSGGALKVDFVSGEAGTADDPFLTLPLPSAEISPSEYGYIALRVKTSKTDVAGQLRFGTATDDRLWSCCEFSYLSTNQWQTVLVDVSSALYMNENGVKTLDGYYTQLRIDPFDNAGEDVEFFIHSYAFFNSPQEAVEFEGIESDNDDTEVKNDMNINKDKWLGEDFSSPPAVYRASKLLYGFSSNYRSVIDRLQSYGYGGIVSNINFNERYLKDPAEFGLLSEAYDYAAEKGMYTWIYDEYQWPSGKAFGQVLEGHDEYEAVGVCHMVLDGWDGKTSYVLPDGYEKIVYAQLIYSDGRRKGVEFDAGSVRQTTVGEKGKLHVYASKKTSTIEEDPSDFATLRNVNLLSKDAMARFITLTYQKYKDSMGESFSNVTTFFTDEPSIIIQESGMIAWDDKLPEVFERMHGYELYENLQSVFEGNSDKDKIIRTNFYQTVSAMFKEAYIDQIADWCDKSGIALSGHLLFEESMNYHINRYGGSFMEIIGGMQLPGVDTLWVEPANLMKPESFIGSYMGIKYVSSASRNRGKGGVFIEFNPAVINDSPFFTDVEKYTTGGVTLSSFFGATDFNMLNPQENYTPELARRFNEYVGRINTVLDGADMTSGIAVFYPIATVQANSDASRKHIYTSTDASQIDEKYRILCKDLLEYGLDYNMLDEESILRSSVSGGKMSVGNAAYSIIIMSYTQVLDVETVRALNSFRSSGGEIIWIGGKPVLPDSVGDTAEFVQLMEQSGTDKVYSVTASCISEVKKHSNINITLDYAEKQKSGKGVLFVSLYKKDGKEIYYIANSSDKDISVDIYSDTLRSYAVYYPYDGTIEQRSAGDGPIVCAGYKGIFIIVS